MFVPSTIDEFLDERIQFCETCMTDKNMSGRKVAEFAVHLENLKYAKNLSEKVNGGNADEKTISLFHYHAGRLLHDVIKKIPGAYDPIIGNMYKLNDYFNELFRAIADIYKQVTGMDYSVGKHGY